jgi:hypothetical protein
MYCLPVRAVLCMCVYYNSKSELLGLISWQAIIYSDVIKSRIQSDDPTNPKYKGIQYENRKNLKRKSLVAFSQIYF